MALVTGRTPTIDVRVLQTDAYAIEPTSPPTLWRCVGLDTTEHRYGYENVLRPFIIRYHARNSAFVRRLEYVQRVEPSPQ